MKRRKRFWFEITCSVLGTVLGLLTMSFPEWIELVFRVEPDTGSGTLEHAVVLGLFVASAISVIVASIEWRRPRMAY